MRHFHPIIVAGWILVSLLATAAYGQEADTLRAVADTTVPVYKLEGITVTVTRARALVNRTPYAIHVLDRRTTQLGETTAGLEEPLGEVAGVWVNNRYNFALGSRISIRGFGSRAQFGVRGVKLLLDGIPLTLPDGQSQLNNIDLASVGRVEVIRGPASSLYGNAAGGVISFTTEEPPLVLAQPELGVLWGTFGDGHDFRKYVGKVGGREGRFDYAASVSHFRTDGFRQRSESQTTVLNTRARLWLDRSTQLSGVLNIANTPVAQNPGSLPLSLATANPDTAWPFNVRRRTGEAARQAQGGVTLRRLIGDAQEIRVSAWGLARDLDNPIPPRIIRVDRAVGGVRLETELAPAGRRVTSLVGGIELEVQDDDRIEFQNQDGSPGDTTLRQDENVRGLGAFAQGAIRVGDRWELTLGARYDRVRFDVDDRLIRVIADSVIDPDNSGTRTMDAFNPMVGVRLAALPWLNVYANLTRTFETPTTTELKNAPEGTGGFNPILDPQTAWGTEIGFKGTVGDRFDYAIANYCTWVSKELIPFEDTIQVGRTFFRNAGDARHCGSELQLGWLVTNGLTASVAYTWSDFKFSDFVRNDSTFDGKRIPGVPIHQAHARVVYQSPLDLYGVVEFTYSDAYFTNDANTARNPSYRLVDLRLGYAGRLGAWSLEPFLGVNNVFDARYNASVTINALGARYYEPGPGRTFYAGLKLPVQVGR
ncbi:MAG: TonB-dependent receptor [Gemmatimonadetes bacterium]|nr:TonB-dependent receptor [Gemmatimonadota bacterium]